ncbi:apolipoprotein N-acyltransferase, partial [candidate division WOR-3 bacterium]|nr:apolipoprotein N-acyltransferase [candidate division WOR-3 bacterium]
GISLWLAVTNLLAYQAIRTRKYGVMLAALIVFALPCGYGLLTLRPDRGQPVHIGVIQPNIDPNLKFNRAMRDETFNRLIHLSEKCANDYMNKRREKLDCILWPETATPVFLTLPGDHQQRVFDLCNRLEIPIFTGTPVYEPRTKDIFNGAVLIVPNRGIQKEYRKIHLVPFGEHIPYDQYIPAFRKIDVGGGDYRPGNTYTVFTLVKTRFSCLICFESIFPELARRFTHLGAQVLFNITNDGWFGRISGPQQHNDMFILRAVENRVPLARSSNTGISMLVDKYGRVVQDTPLFKEKYICGTVHVMDQKTIYQTIGDAVPLGALIAIAGALILSIFRRRAVCVPVDLAP